MRLITTIPDTQSFSREVRARGKSLGLVPTMGALHEGHLSLVRRARSECDVLVTSIFVNPAQFGPSEDLARYPRNLEHDQDLLRALKVDVVFTPPAESVYPPGFDTYVLPGEVAAPFEGTSRPGHFRGVATVVLKLLNVVQPDLVYFGQKDFQQVQVVRAMVNDLNLQTKLVVCPIVREPDGLALSSRNAYLSAEERQAATILHRSLRRAEEMAHNGETRAPTLVEEIQQVFSIEPRAQLEYVAIVEPIRLKSVERLSAGCVALVAARVGSARLIDNLIFGPPGESPEALIRLAMTFRPPESSQTATPGLEIEILKKRIERCRDCAAVAAIRLPPAEFLVKHVRRYYPDLRAVRVAIIARDSPLNQVNYLYARPENETRFVTALYRLVGVRGFDEFRHRFVLTDAVRCHCTNPRVPEKALDLCSKFLPEELRLFPNLATLVVLGEDAYLQVQKHLLQRRAGEIRPLNQLLDEKGWAIEETRVASMGERLFKIIYCHHPTLAYRRSPSIAALLA